MTIRLFGALLACAFLCVGSSLVAAQSHLIIGLHVVGAKKQTGTANSSNQKRVKSSKFNTRDRMGGGGRQGGTKRASVYTCMTDDGWRTEQFRGGMSALGQKQTKAQDRNSSR